MAPTPSRRRLLRAALSGAVAGLAGCADDPPSPVGGGTGGATTDEPADAGETTTGADGTPTDDGDDSTPAGRVGLETVASGLGPLVDVAFAPDADRRYVAQQSGEVLVHGPDGVREEPFLDLGDAVTVGGEKGLLGLALHPRFAENRRCYVRYSAPPRGDTPRGYSHTFVLAEFTATDDGRRTVGSSERAVLEIPQPQGNHNAGGMAFGPEGLLYVAVGDGGGGGDRGTGHADDWYDPVAGGNGQDVEANLLGSILRIDVDGREGGKPYAVPADNPLVGEAGFDEQYAWGLRNPWRLSVDPEGDLVDGAPDIYTGDVGQNRFEEVDLVRPGGNYGWNVREGRHCYGADDCPDATPDGDPLLDPVVEYPHSGAPVSGISVIGGYRYRGDALAGLQGRYVFADWNAGGELFVAAPDGDGAWDAGVLDVDDGGRLVQVRSFGRDHDGELYVLAKGSEWGLHRLVPA